MFAVSAFSRHDNKARSQIPAAADPSSLYRPSAHLPSTRVRSWLTTCRACYWITKKEPRFVKSLRKRGNCACDPRGGRTTRTAQSCLEGSSNSSLVHFSMDAGPAPRALSPASDPLPIGQCEDPLGHTWMKSG
jgi:hypothetical protein